MDSIAELGLKHPITVSDGANGDPYELVWGQGRLEAFQALGQTTVSAVDRDYTVEQRLLHGIIKNVARRHYRPKELLQDIGAMQQREYSCEMIAGEPVLPSAMLARSRICAKAAMIGYWSLRMFAEFRWISWSGYLESMA